MGGLLPQLAVAVLEHADEQVQGLRILDRAERLGDRFARFGARSRLQHLDQAVNVSLPPARRDDEDPEVLQETRALQSDVVLKKEGYSSGPTDRDGNSPLPRPASWMQRRGIPGGHPPVLRTRSP